MEVNTILLSKTDYDDLIKFKHDIENSGTVTAYYHWGHEKIIYYTSKDAVREIGEKNKELKNRIDTLEKKNTKKDGVFRRIIKHLWD